MAIRWISRLSTLFGSMRLKTNKAETYGRALIVVAGNIATGKTTLCTHLSNQLGVPCMEINNPIKGHFDVLIVESTGLGARTTELKRSFARHYVVKCAQSPDQVVANIEARKKQFKQHEIRLGLSEIDFYNHCKADIDRLPCRFTYRYQDHSIDALLANLRVFLCD